LLEDQRGRGSAALRTNPAPRQGQRDELGIEPRGSLAERGVGGRRETFFVENGDSMLELVVGEVPIGLCMVALGPEIGERLAALVGNKLLVDHLPADRLSPLERCECVPSASAIPASSDAEHRVPHDRRDAVGGCGTAPVSRARVAGRFRPAPPRCLDRQTDLQAGSTSPATRIVRG
jgi:hypothetical protein